MLEQAETNGSRPRWRAFPVNASRLRVAAWIAGFALAVHAIAMVVDWTLLAGEQRNLRRQAEA
jgi:general secretion pathway protein L